MSLIVSIDTSTRGCSVALHQNGQLLTAYDLLAEKSSSGMLTTLIQQAVEHAGFHLSELDAVAVAKGPGSYTGLRIAVSTAKGLCFALDKPLLSVNTLEAMALQVSGFYNDSSLLCPMLDARRMEVYCAVFDRTLRYVEPTQAKIIESESFAELLQTHKVVFFGDGAAKCRAVFGAYENAVFLPVDLYPSAKTVGQLAVELFESRHFEDPETFEPFYLKEFMTTVPKKARVGL
ncbi:tRNA (adenosine(37)-N6)-threonylcarbamoyltransferase complex dimerization subunit type 1 TsaB [Runella slithyformis]|uniref:Universal protein YeaZ n=1 Tax=Runella slithyformis (strain ATCC 29530 / DSM 19594 / LMG 11500 / NCIMB 11436 / LSU 4) TaxID=761193 RepID=A0A7U3ZMX3_RUNSL|nr:tRNA (adenosine(37)-N6)-threonylcarbamoyltransferase complex dimerization subunit type 1 TsaB [Runella slithyformis]AEI50117.1 universal protein YeaZ [Runella slithyformis DSM 19594]